MQHPPGWCDGSHIVAERPPHTSLLVERRESDEANQCMGIIRRPWWSEATREIWSGCRDYTPTLFRRTFLMTTESQDLGLKSHPKDVYSLRGVLTFVASGLDINSCVLSYFEGAANVHCYTSCTHFSKVSFLQWCHMKIYNKIFTKMWRVYSLLWDAVCAWPEIYHLGQKAILFYFWCMRSSGHHSLSLLENILKHINFYLPWNKEYTIQGSMFIFLKTITLIWLFIKMLRRKKRVWFRSSFLSVSIPTGWGLAVLERVNGTENWCLWVKTVMIVSQSP